MTSADPTLLDSSPLLPIVQFVGQTIFIMALIMTGLAACIRLRAIRDAKRHIEDIWTLRFTNPMPQDLVNWPIDRRDHLAVLTIWNRVYDTSSTDHKRSLEQLALKLNFPQIALDHALDPPLETRLLCIITLGRLRVTAAWTLLEQLPRADNPILSFAATRALFAINPDRAIRQYAKYLFRPDWSPTKVAECLQEVEESLLAETFLRWLRQTRSVPHAIRIIRYLGATRCVPALPALRRYLDVPYRHPRILAEGLHTLTYFRCREDHPRFLAATRSDIWQLRVRGAIGLGLVGSPADLPTLKTLLHDPNWWVRYRAAEAITKLTKSDPDAISQLMQDQTDLFAHDALQAFVAATSTDPGPMIKSSHAPSDIPELIIASGTSPS